jgi:hypothetical protein
MSDDGRILRPDSVMVRCYRCGHTIHESPLVLDGHDWTVTTPPCEDCEQEAIETAKNNIDNPKTIR